MLFPEIFWSITSSSSNFCSVDFVNRAISFISFRGCWNKTKLCEVLWCLRFFVKSMNPEIFGFLEKLKSLIQKKGHIDSWVRIESLQAIYIFSFIWFCKNNQPAPWDLCFTCLPINLVIWSKCVLILSIDYFFLPTEFMYVMVSITLSSMIVVIIGSKINSVVCDW